MAPDLNNAASPTDREKQKNLDQEVREMISTLTSRLGSIQRSHAQADDDEQGMRMITLAGTNLGATMRGDLDDKATAPQLEQEDSASYVVNSNFQAINNSIMLGGSYKTNDPGVHLDITDYVDHNDGDKKGKKSRRGGHDGGHHHGKRSDNLSDTESEKN
ncbi:hypothetical protein SASPL_152000 [Salvia splendens]|uniref:Uncharacterized protein n=1 Tax=Salvia splendens TaxID=180675 RepID=A0A4D9AU00_SALSN|nr:uncharacterized protein LOC121784067 [Salvia splendens]XP_042045515.1 uncharacterized protein LOC121791722 [Salvia splendens]KAG6382845.1 hypothetical protein SASPL_157433 [Salvia splendens]KAG6386824.1 hypothetical protein SASPL_152000 [Salvia splendens]